MAMNEVLGKDRAVTEIEVHCFNCLCEGHVLLTKPKEAYLISSAVAQSYVFWRVVSS
jgi:hypothetical protein